MKVILTILTVLSFNLSFGQDFKLVYWITGLGSNATWYMAEEYKDCASGLKIEINDTVLTYSICERAEKYRIDTVFNDTIWTKERNFYHVKFRESSIDSIISILDTLQGKYVYRTNPLVMSGGTLNYYIEYGGKCSQFVMKNTYDSTALQITNLINSYLDEKYHIYVPDSRWASNKYDKPLIEACPRDGNGTYREVLEQEYDVIKKK
ncbi:hypothetical protein KFE94_02865 [bacterium SCSIO 12643]|nr:hypothetical protein KFE94_02865 [bacterium SCSIO 12643]